MRKLKMIEHPKLFISYSHDNENHKRWVKKLATDLRRDMGVDVIFDQWDLRAGRDVSLFMEHGLSSDALVVCICSNRYVLKANEGTGGVGYEKMILTKNLLKSTDIDYIIPIMRFNETRDLPNFLGTKKYIDFTEDSSYCEKLYELVSRIYNEDITQKPSLGKSPFSKENTNEIIVKTLIEKTAYHNPEMVGSASFDFTNNNGQYNIGSGAYEFCTTWSECGEDTIYGYSDNVKMIGYSFGTFEIPKNNDLLKFDFTSRVRQVTVGEILIWVNGNGKIAATRITNIATKSRGAAENILAFDYKIYE